MSHLLDVYQNLIITKYDKKRKNYGRKTNNGTIRTPCIFFVIKDSNIVLYYLALKVINNWKYLFGNLSVFDKFNFS